MFLIILFPKVSSCKYAAWSISPKNLSKKTAKILMEDWVGSVSCNLRSFEKLDNSVAQILINNGYYNVIARDIDMFKNLTNKTLLSLLVNCTKFRRRIMLCRLVFPN